MTFTPETKAKEEEDEFDYFDYDSDSSTSTAEPKKTYIDHLHDCIGNPYTTLSSFNTTCLGTFGGPTFPYLVFGGETEDSKDVSRLFLLFLLVPFSL